MDWPVRHAPLGFRTCCGVCGTVSVFQPPFPCPRGQNLGTEGPRVGKRKRQQAAVSEFLNHIPLPVTSVYHSSSEALGHKLVSPWPKLLQSLVMKFLDVAFLFFLKRLPH